MILILLATIVAGKVQYCEDPSKMEAGNYYIKVVNSKENGNSINKKFHEPQDGKGPFLYHDHPKSTTEDLGLKVFTPKSDEIQENAIFFVEPYGRGENQHFEYKMLRIFSKNKDYVLTIKHGKLSSDLYLMHHEKKEGTSFKYGVKGKKAENIVIQDGREKKVSSFQYGVETVEDAGTYELHARENERQVRLKEKESTTQLYLEWYTLFHNIVYPDNTFFCFQKLQNEKNVNTNKLNNNIEDEEKMNTVKEMNNEPLDAIEKIHGFLDGIEKPESVDQNSSVISFALSSIAFAILISV